MSVSTDPDVLTVTLDTMSLAELHDTAQAVLNEFALVVESAGAQRRDITIACSHAESSPPTFKPVCRCACPSRRDHWFGLLQAASARDLDRGGEPHATRDVLLQAAEDLRLARRGPRDRPEADAYGHSSHRGPERHDFIIRRYAGIPAARAARLETARAGHIDAAAIRRARRRSGYGMNLGEPLAPDDDLVDQVLIRHRMGDPDREIAMHLDIGVSSVKRILEGRRSDLESKTVAA